MDQPSHNSSANGSGIGQPVRRREDFRLVRGGGRYTADENLPGQVYAVMVRSPHAHARIRAIATDKAKAAPGVLAVLTGADFLADGLKPIPHKPWSPHPAEAKLHNKGGEPPFEAPHFPLPTDKARFVGEAVAMVVAETVHAAKDAAEQIEIEYEVLPAVVETIAAARQDAPHVHGGTTNVCFDSELGDAAATEVAFARAAHVTRFETWVQLSLIHICIIGIVAAADFAAGKLDVAGQNIELLGADRFELVAHLHGGHVGGNRGARGKTARIGAGRDRPLVLRGVHFQHDFDIVAFQAELIGNDLRQHGLVALALHRDVGGDRDGAERINIHLSLIHI